MHDTLAQQLTGLVVQLEAARAAAISAAPGDAGAHYDQAIGQARSSLRDARRSMQALRYEAVDHHDLPAALRALVARAEGRPGLVVFGSIADAAPPWSSRAQSELLRMAQEAVTNALRHAQAQTLTVTWERTAEAWVLEVHDDGIGFGPGRGSDGMGLAILGERAARLGAVLSIESGPGRGTRIRVVRPDRGEAPARTSAARVDPG
jgi:signal transduction histidine kinase